MFISGFANIVTKTDYVYCDIGVKLSSSIVGVLTISTSELRPVLSPEQTSGSCDPPTDTFSFKPSQGDDVVYFVDDERQRDRETRPKSKSE